MTHVWKKKISWNLTLKLIIQTKVTAELSEKQN